MRLSVRRNHVVESGRRADALARESREIGLQRGRPLGLRFGRRAAVHGVARVRKRPCKPFLVEQHSHLGVDRRGFARVHVANNQDILERRRRRKQRAERTSERAAVPLRLRRDKRVFGVRNKGARGEIQGQPGIRNCVRRRRAEVDRCERRAARVERYRQHAPGNAHGAASGHSDGDVVGIVRGARHGDDAGRRARFDDCRITARGVDRGFDENNRIARGIRDESRGFDGGAIAVIRDEIAGVARFEQRVCGAGARHADDDDRLAAAGRDGSEAVIQDGEIYRFDRHVGPQIGITIGPTVSPPGGLICTVISRATPPSCGVTEYGRTVYGGAVTGVQILMPNTSSRPRI